jgi:hypothetical protein
LPFLIIQESVGRTASIGDLPTGRGARGWHDWNMELIFFLSRGENHWPSLAASKAELQHRNWAIAVNDLLARNQTLGNTVFSIIGQVWQRQKLNYNIEIGQTLGNTVFSIGEKRGAAFSFADYLIDYEQWDQEIFWSMRFLIPVTQIYDRGG